MKKYLFVIFNSFFLLFLSNNLSAQCEISVNAIYPSSNTNNIVCGDEVQLVVTNAFGVGDVVFEEDFNSGAPTGWQSTSQASYNNPCSPGVDGTPHLWMGDAASVPRIMTTEPFNLSTAVAGASICFDLLFATQGVDAPCEGPDEPDEGVFLEYSTDGGNTWTEIHYFNPNGGFDDDLINWNNWCFSLPADAISPTTQIRWIQTSDSGSQYDHWGIDNVQIFFNDPDYTISWTHDNYEYPFASTGGVNPNPVSPQTSTTYTAQITNGVETCEASVTIDVIQPVADISVAQDTAICPGECVTLTGDPRIVKRPAKTPTYSNNNITPVANAFGATTTSTITINDLNMDELLPGSITEVCINNLGFFGTDFQIFPPAIIEQNIGDLILRLICPDGSSIILVPQGQTTSSDPLEGYNGACFVPVGGSDISQDSPNYSGTYAPGEPLDNLVGCSANGNWVLELETASAGGLGLGIGFGLFSGWNITFDDPEISYEGDFTWASTDNLTNENTLTPTACVSQEETFTFTVVDTAGCIAPAVAEATISIDPDCCPITFVADVTEPTCGENNGSIDLTVLDGSGDYTYTWDNGETTAEITNLEAGSYTVTVFDVILDCERDTTITLSAGNALVLDSVLTTFETCLGDDDATAEVFVSGGTGNLTYVWSSGGNAALEEDLAPGSYTVTVTDEEDCEVEETVVIDAGEPCCELEISEVNITQPNCGESDGSIELVLINGSGNYSFDWDNGGNTNPLTNLASGSYAVTVTDLDANDVCEVDTIINVSDLDAPEIDNIIIIDETCFDANDASIEIIASGGIGALSFSWSSGGNAALEEDLGAGSYTITVADENDCEVVETITVNDGPDCCDFSIVANITPSTCNNSDGGIALTINDGVGPFEIIWGGGETTEDLQLISAGTYTVNIVDLGVPTLCELDTTFTVEDADGPVIDNLTVTDESCEGEEDGNATLEASGGTGQLTISWSSGGNGLTEDSIAAGDYTVTVTDENNCSTSEDFTVVAGGLCCDLEISEILTTGETCLGFEDGEATVINTGGIVPLSYNWNGNVTSEDIEIGLAAGTYSLTITDDNNCEATEIFEIEAGIQVSIFIGNDTTIIEGDSLQLNVNVSGGTTGSATWSPQTGLSCTDCLNPMASPSSDIVYFVTYIDDLGCVATDEISIEISPEEPFCLFPDAFTPNGDNVNDFFRGICERVVFLEMKIYNRWGELIFEEQGTNNFTGWDGTYKGRDANLGVYVYKVNVQFDDGTTEMYMGNLSLIR